MCFQVVLAYEVIVLCKCSGNVPIGYYFFVMEHVVVVDVFATTCCWYGPFPGSARKLRDMFVSCERIR